MSLSLHVFMNTYSCFDSGMHDSLQVYICTNNRLLLFFDKETLRSDLDELRFAGLSTLLKACSDLKRIIMILRYFCTSAKQH